MCNETNLIKCARSSLRHIRYSTDCLNRKVTEVMDMKKTRQMSGADIQKMRDDAENILHNIRKFRISHKALQQFKF